MVERPWWQNWVILSDRELQELSNDQILELNARSRAYVRYWRYCYTCSAYQHEKNKDAYGDDYRTKVREVESMYKRATIIYQQRVQKRMFKND